MTDTLTKPKVKAPKPTPSSVRDYASADAYLNAGRDGNRRPLGGSGGNTTLVRRSATTIAVQLHYTDVVTYHKGGTVELANGGWRTVTTMARIREYCGLPNRYGVGSAGGTWIVQSDADPLTPPVMRKCRDCKGSGEVTRDTFSPVECDDYPGYCYTRENPGRYGECTGHNVATGFEVVECSGCKGTKVKDYGSHPDPIVFHDGIRVNQRTGKVVNARAEVRLSKMAEAAVKARKAQERARAKAEAEYVRTRPMREATLQCERAWHALAAHTAEARATTEGDGVTVYYKAVTHDLMSPIRGYADALTYSPGSRVEADGLGSYAGSCSQGVNFCATVKDALSWYSGGKVVAITVPKGETIIDPLRAGEIGARKLRALRVDVLHVVDLDGEAAR